MGLVAVGFEMASRTLWWPDAITAGASKRGGSGLRLTNEQLCELVAAVAAGRDREAFAQLFRYFAPRLKGFGLRRGVDVGAAEELTQETMLTVWRKADTFDPGRATVSTWVFTIVRNKRIDLFRRESYPEADLSEASEAPAEDRPPDESVSMSEAGGALRTAMKTLPKSELEVIRKAFFEDKSHRAIAEEMNLPLGTVKSRIRLALARIRVALPEGHV
jgi:RNA polymerase sigma-70 factor (ECF subfamily)